MRAAAPGETLFPLAPGLLAVTGGEQSGKTRLLRQLAGDLPPLPGQPAGLDAVWLDLALPSDADQTPDQVWSALQSRCPHWQQDVLEALVDALNLSPHRGKQLFMLSAGSRRKVGLVGLLACGAQVTCLDQPYAALDQGSIGVVRDFLQDMADHDRRTWVVADYEADPHVPWRQVLALGG